MHRIRSWLSLGNRKDVRNPGLLAAKGITAMFQLAVHVEQVGITVCFVRIEDGDPLPTEHLRKGVGFVLG